MKKLIIILSLVLVSTGCTPYLNESKDDKKCLKSHTEYKIIFFPNARGGLKQILVPFKVCDKYDV